MSINDNEPAVPVSILPPRDADGQAALLLVESLIHGLCERSTLAASDAIAIVERAIEVQQDLAEVADGAAGPMWRSHALLSAIARSLKSDGDRDAAPPASDGSAPRAPPEWLS